MFEWEAQLNVSTRAATDTGQQKYMEQEKQKRSLLRERVMTTSLSYVYDNDRGILSASNCEGK